MRFFQSREVKNAIEAKAAEAKYMSAMGTYKTNHILHLLLSFFTWGIWLPIWFLVSWSNSCSVRRAERKFHKSLSKGF